MLPVEEQADPHHKSKVRTLQQYIGKLQSRYEEEGILYDHKVNAMFDHLRRIEHLVKDTTNELEIEGTPYSPRQHMEHSSCQIGKSSQKTDHQSRKSHTPPI